MSIGSPYCMESKLLVNIHQMDDGILYGLNHQGLRVPSDIAFACCQCVVVEIPGAGDPYDDKYILWIFYR